MSAYVSNLVISCGASFSQNFLLDGSDGNSLDLTSYSGASHIRKSPSSSSYVGFGVSFVDPINGEIKLSLGSTVTASLDYGRYVYDVRLIDSGGKKTIVLEGMILARGGISTT